jgi:hypothetical protein
VRDCAYWLTASEYPQIVELDNREAESLFVEATTSLEERKSEV